MTPPDARTSPAATTPRRLAWSWLVVGGLVIVVVWLAGRLALLRSEMDLLRTELELADVALRAARQQLEAERILAQHRGGVQPESARP